MDERSFYFRTKDKDGLEQRIVVTIDVDAIASRLAPRVRKSKLGKATALDGAVKAERLETQD